MPSPQLELKSDIASLFKDLEDIASTTQVNAPHIPTIKNEDITELFSGLNEAHKEAQIEVELKLSLNEKEKLEAFSTLIETFDEIIQPESTPEVIQEKIVEPINEGAKLEALEQLFSELIEPEPIVEIVEEPKNIIVDEVETESLVEEPTNVEKKADLVDKAIVHLNDMQEKTTVKEEVTQIATLRKEFDNFRLLIGKQISSSQMSGTGGGEVRLEFMDDVDRNTAKVDGKFLKYQASTNKFVGADAGDTITDEQLQDVVGGMISSNTESGITVTYDDTNGKLDFTVGTLNQDTTGNADTATTLETARDIGGVSFDGSANIDLPGVNTTGNQNTTGSAAILTTSRTIGGVSFDGSSNIDLAGVNISGNQDTSGNAATATALETARTIHGVSFDGSANIDLSEVVQDTVGAMFSSNTETGITVTYQDADGTIDLVIGTLNQNTTGNAATATALETARTIAGQSFNGTANIAIASTDLSNTSAITLLTSSQTLTNKTLTSPVINTGISGTAFLDEDDLSSDSATKVASQQSIKAYVDAAELRTRAFAIAIGAGL